MKSILIVEDNREMLELLNDIFGEDYKLLYAANGEKAEEIFLKYSPALLITDLIMPKQDGVQLIHKVRRQNKTPVIAISGEPDRLAEAKEAGADIIVTKPFKITEIIEHARILLNESL